MVKHHHYWQFWIDDHGRDRLFFVGEPDFHVAEKVALDHVSYGKTVSYQVLPHTVAEFVGLGEGEARELAPATMNDKLTPGGIMRGGRRDAKGP